jgi:hypothetical protein
MTSRMMQKRYPKPDIKEFLRNVGGMAFFLGILHLAPDIMVWIYANWLGTPIVINEKRHHAVMVIAYVVAGIPIAIWIVGACYATMKNRKRKDGAGTKE